MAFSKESLDFLFENSFRDSKEWYQEHKEDYQTYVIAPFVEFIQKMQPCMDKIDSEIICDPRKIPRIYRDTRFSKDKSIFRSDLWYSFSRRRSAMDILPEFYFDISPEGYTYGLGYYQAGTARMEIIRSMVLAGDKKFLAAQKAYKKQSVFELCGEEYKKNHYPECSEEIVRWVNKKNLYFSKYSNDFDTLYREDLTDIISADFLAMADVYRFFMEAEQRMTRA